MKKYVGIVLDELTTPIGARIVQDVMAMLTITDMYKMDLVICTEEKRLKAILNGLAEVVSDLSKPRLFISYKAGDEYAEVPDNCTILVTRNFKQGQSNQRLDLVPRAGHPLKNFRDRISYSNMNRIWNHPNGYAPPDAAMIMMWGPVKA